MKKSYIKPQIVVIDIETNDILAMSFRNDRGSASISEQSVNDDTEEWEGVW